MTSPASRAGNLVGPGHSPVFAHASLTLDVERAATLVAALPSDR